MIDDIYVALDFASWQEAASFINQYHLHGVPVKVGMELFYREGPDIIKRLKENNHAIFLDLKLHDIPTTVYKAMKNIAKLDVDMVNVHALGGQDMIRRAKEGLIEGNHSGHHTTLIAVTMLTSFNPLMLEEELMISEHLEDYVVHLAKLTKASGGDGVVCSVHEVEAVKQACGSSFVTVTPGIRLAGGKHHDQTRIATPALAKEKGADKLVIGRSITQASNPQQAFQQATKEWNDERQK